MKTYHQPQAPIGSTVTGAFIKEGVALGWITIDCIFVYRNVHTAKFNQEKITEIINDATEHDFFAVLVSNLSGSVYFHYLYSNDGKKREMPAAICEIYTDCIQLRNGGINAA